LARPPPIEAVFSATVLLSMRTVPPLLATAPPKPAPRTAAVSAGKVSTGALTPVEGHPLTPALKKSMLPEHVNQLRDAYHAAYQRLKGNGGKTQLSAVLQEAIDATKAKANDLRYIQE
jgi:hypothetical protein